MTKGDRLKGPIVHRLARHTGELSLRWLWRKHVSPSAVTEQTAGVPLLRTPDQSPLATTQANSPHSHIGSLASSYLGSLFFGITYSSSYLHSQQAGTEDKDKNLVPIRSAYGVQFTP